MQTHRLPKPLAAGALVYRSIANANQALVFIHGFNGKAVKTWQEFPRLLPNTATTANCDIFFFGYDSLKRRVRVSAIRFREFLEGDVLSSSGGIPSEDSADRVSKYESLIIVAHSVGAVVARRALLDAAKLRSPWLQRSRLVLFAPAHMGAHIVPLVAESLSFLRHLPFSPMLHLWFPILYDVREGSQTLTLLREDTLRALAQGVPGMRAAVVAISESDIVVNTNDFCEDPVPFALKASHTGICKPSDAFLEPLNVVRSVL